MQALYTKRPHTPTPAMKSTVVWIVFATMLMSGGEPVSAWGGVFNRFTPELLGNLGYGGAGVSNGNSANALFYEVCAFSFVCWPA